MLLRLVHQSAFSQWFRNIFSDGIPVFSYGSKRLSRNLPNCTFLIIEFLIVVLVDKIFTKTL